MKRFWVLNPPAPLVRWRFWLLFFAVINENVFVVINIFLKKNRGYQRKKFRGYQHFFKRKQKCGYKRKCIRGYQHFFLTKILRLSIFLFKFLFEIIKIFFQNNIAVINIYGYQNSRLSTLSVINILGYQYSRLSTLVVVSWRLLISLLSFLRLSRGIPLFSNRVRILFLCLL